MSNEKLNVEKMNTDTLVQLIKERGSAVRWDYIFMIVLTLCIFMHCSIPKILEHDMNVKRMQVEVTINDIGDDSCQ